MRVLDLRTLADEWNDELVDLAEGRGPDGLEGPSLGEMADRVGKYEALCSDLGIEQTPDALLAYANEHQPTLIHEDDFTDYAREFAEDVHGDGARELGSYVDWERFADALRIDYTTVEYDGDTYLMRS